MCLWNIATLLGEPLFGLGVGAVTSCCKIWAQQIHACLPLPPVLMGS